MNAASLILVAMFVAAPFTITPAEACGDYRQFKRLDRFATQVLSENPEEAAAAVQALRDEGPMGLWALFGKYHKQLNADAPVGGPLSDETKRLRAAVDKVAGQKDAHASRLFWHTDLDNARAAAKQSNRPILSLRLLGRLDEDLSCANSRFFRTALYANDDVANALRRGFVLHWKSVRPVPVITIDFGDGRKICRTITGNSIHHVLDADGRPLDALPGLYGPKAFLKHLEHANQLFVSLSSTQDIEVRTAAIRAWHATKRDESDAARAADLTRIGLPAAPAGGSIDDETWSKLATLHAGEARLDERSKALMRAKSPDAVTAMRVAVSKMVVEDPMVRLVRRFERTLAEDTVRNEYDFHRSIHSWFARGEVQDVDRLNERVYAQLFLTPASDPWLGLVRTDAYAGLDHGGLALRTR